MQYSNHLQSFVKMTLLELATNTQIDHRNYAKPLLPHPAKVSPLADYIHAHRACFDHAITSLCDSIISKPNVMKIIQTLQDLHSATNTKDHNGDDTDDEGGDDIEELETELFNVIVDLTGLFEIHSLHPDDIDRFKEKFLKELRELF